MTKGTIFTQNVIFCNTPVFAGGSYKLSSGPQSVCPSICNAVFSGLAHNFFCMKLGFNNERNGAFCEPKIDSV